jgi:glycine/D-amino acid oxidase-like deaminating enzyme
MEHFDYIVVGAGFYFKFNFCIKYPIHFCLGIEGTWTAYQLLRDSPKPTVLLVERFQLPHTRGSSHGQSRVIRHSYAEHFHTALMPKAFAEWRQLEIDTNTTLLTWIKLHYKQI